MDQVVYQAVLMLAYLTSEIDDVDGNLYNRTQEVYTEIFEYLRVSRKVMGILMTFDPMRPSDLRIVLFGLPRLVQEHAPSRNFTKHTNNGQPDTASAEACHTPLL